MLGRILVVDDEANNRDLLSRRLTRRDYQVVTAASAYEALSILNDEEFDLLILDIMMPGMSGLEMLTVVRQSFSSSQLPVIMATAKSDSEDVVEALNRGANDYVTKPLDMPVTLARIERALKERNATLALAKMNQSLLLSQSASGTAEVTTDHSGDVTSESQEGKLAAAERPTKPLAVGGSIGKYKLRDTLGVGGSGKVFLGYDPLIERKVAIKVLSEKYSTDRVWTERFLKEAKAIGQLDHPNIISIYDVNVDQGFLYIVMEYAEHGNLKGRTNEQGPLTLAEACRCIVEAAHGLNAAHDNRLIHRDVKPDNLLLSASDQIKVSDFGIVKNQEEDLDDPGLTREGRRIGTPLYMSPEQVKMQEVDRRADIYSLGGTFFFLLTGKPPFLASTIDEVTAAHLKDPRPDPASINHDLPVTCAAVIAKAMAIERDDRYASMLEFADAVEAIVS